MPNTKIHLRIRLDLLRKANLKDIFLFKFISGIFDPDTVNSLMPHSSTESIYFILWKKYFIKMQKQFPFNMMLQ